MLIVMRAVVGLAAIGGGLEFVRERSRPLLPGEIPLLGELHSEGECLRLPGLGKYRSAFIARQGRQSGKPFRIGCRIMLAQGSHPTSRYKRYPAAWPARPTIRARKNVRRRHAAASRRGIG